MKLNIGSGEHTIDGFVNLDAKFNDVVFPLPYNNLDEIRASHILEHFGCMESVDVICNWVSCLKVGGVLKIAVPDFMDLVRRLAIGECIDYEGIIMGGQTDELDYHKSLWWDRKLREIMEGAGLSDIQSWQSEIKDCASLPISLNLKGVRKCQE